MRMADLQYKKQQEAMKTLDAMSKERQQAELARVREAEKEVERSAKNWEEEAISGASLGMTAGGPMGALIGAIGGAAYGQYKAVKYRQDEEGQGFLEAFGKTHMDTPFFNVGEAIDKGSFQAGADGAMGLPGEGYVKSGLGMAAGAAGSTYDQRQAQEGIPEGGYWDPDKMNAMYGGETEGAVRSRRQSNLAKDVSYQLDLERLNEREQMLQQEDVDAGLGRLRRRAALDDRNREAEGAERAGAYVGSQLWGK
jgi:hypothetical protein